MTSKLGLSVVSVLMVAAAAAGSASAAGETVGAKFFVEGAELAGSKTVTGSAVTNGVLETEIAGLPVKLESKKLSCQSCKIENKEVTSKAGKVAFGSGTIKFEEASVVEPKSCTVKDEGGTLSQVVTKPLFIHGDWMDTTKANERAFVQLIPQTGSTFAQFTLGGTGCEAIAGARNVTGSVFGESANKTGFEAAKQELVLSPTVQSTTGAKLLVGTKEAKFTGTSAFELSTKEKFMISTGVVQEPTSLTTSLSGESKSGASITVLEGSKVKDQATLEGKNAAKATGKISYAVYADSSCKELVTSAGESEFKEGKVPASGEMTLEGGRVYYWQAHYGGDSLNGESTSACGSEVLTVKAATSLAVTLFAEEEAAIEGAEITVFEGTEVDAAATLSGTNSTTATGNLDYSVYADNECEELVTGAGEVSVEAGEASASEEVELKEGTYYWQAAYSGDALHQESKSVCGKAVQVVNPPKFFAESYPAIAKGGPATIVPHTFSTGFRAVTCNKATLTSSAFGNATGDVVLTPRYEECTSTGGLPATVVTNNCVYRVSATRSFTIENCFNAKIELLVYASAADHTAGTILCKYKITNQANLKKMTFVNEGVLFGRDMTFRFQIGGMTITKVEGGEEQCGESTTQGTYGGSTTMRGRESAPPNAIIDLWRG
ncbi:MAG TPA: hypothetical protein VGI17_01150 [Solirubrobacterales bacterium]|jgi:hypothetical protein